MVGFGSRLRKLQLLKSDCSLVLGLLVRFVAVVELLSVSLSIGKVGTITTLERATGKRVPRTCCQVVTFYPQLRHGYIRHTLIMGKISRRSRGHTKYDQAEVTHTAEKYLV